MGDKKKKFVFVDWLEDNSVGVMPTTAIQKGQKVGIGEICVLRWGKGEFYDAKLLKFSDDRQALLAHMERYIAGVDLDAPDTADSTTEDTPIKTPPSAPKKSKQTKSIKRKAAEARKESSVARAKNILASINFSNESSSSEEDEKDLEIKRLKKELEKMQNQHDSSMSSVVMNNSISHSSFDALQKTVTNDAGPSKPGGSALKVSYADKWDNGPKPGGSAPRTSHYDDRTSHYDDSWNYGPKPGGSTPKTSPYSDSSDSSDESDEEEGLCEYEKMRLKKMKENHALMASLNLLSAKEELKTLSKKRLKVGHPQGHKKPRVGTRIDPLSLLAGRTPTAHKVDPTQGRKLELGSGTVNVHGNETKKQKMQEVELVHGYGVYLTRRQLDECVDGAGTSSTRLMRNLLSVFFTPDQLAMSSAMGTRRHIGLDQDILSACIKFVQSKFTVSRAVLIDATNDKCSQYRRKNVHKTA